MLFNGISVRRCQCRIDSSVRFHHRPHLIPILISIVFSAGAFFLGSAGFFAAQFLGWVTELNSGPGV